MSGRYRMRCGRSASGPSASFVNGLDLSAEQFFWLSQFIILPARLAARVDRDHDHLHADLPAAARHVPRPLPDSIATDPFFFGIMAGLNQQTSFLTPPMAMSAYYMKGILGKSIQLTEIFRGFMPFMGCQILAMLVLWVAPWLAYGPAEAVFGKAIIR